jgi:hypothetical protein
MAVSPAKSSALLELANGGLGEAVAGSAWGWMGGSFWLALGGRASGHGPCTGSRHPGGLPGLRMDDQPVLAYCFHLNTIGGLDV